MFLLLTARVSYVLIYSSVMKHRYTGQVVIALLTTNRLLIVSFLFFLLSSLHVTFSFSPILKLFYLTFTAFSSFSPFKANKFT